MATSTLSPSQAFGKGKDLFFKHWKTVALFFAAMIGIQIAAGITVGSLLGSDSALYSLFSSLLSSYLGFGFIKGMILLYNGKSADIKVLFQPIQESFKFIVGSFLYQLAVGLGMILLIIPGIYVATKYFFVPLLLADTNMGIGEAFTASAKMSKGRQMDLFLFLVLSVLAMFVGIFALFVGVFAAAAMMGFGTIALYYNLQSKAK